MEVNPLTPRSSPYTEVPLLLLKADYPHLWQLPAPLAGSEGSGTLSSIMPFSQ